MNLWTLTLLSLLLGLIVGSLPDFLLSSEQCTIHEHIVQAGYEFVCLSRPFSPIYYIHGEFDFKGSGTKGPCIRGYALFDVIILSFDKDIGNSNATYRLIGIDSNDYMREMDHATSTDDNTDVDVVDRFRPGFKTGDKSTCYFSASDKARTIQLFRFYSIFQSRMLR